MSLFTVVYEFLCSNCKLVNSGKQVFEATDAEQASHMLSAVELPCRNCVRSVTGQTIAKTFVFAADAQDEVESTNPAVPRT